MWESSSELLHAHPVQSLHKISTELAPTFSLFIKSSYLLGYTMDFTMPAIPVDILPLAEQGDQDDSSPVPAIHLARGGLMKDLTSEESNNWKNQLRLFLFAVRTKDCVDTRNCTREATCQCMKSLNLSEDDAVSASEFLFGFALTSKMEQQTMVKEWIKYSWSLSKGYQRNEPEYERSFLLPGTEYLICKNALCYILGCGSTA